MEYFFLVEISIFFSLSCNVDVPEECVPVLFLPELLVLPRQQVHDFLQLYIFSFFGGRGDFFWGEIYSILFTLTLIYPKKRAEQYSCA